MMISFLPRRQSISTGTSARPRRHKSTQYTRTTIVVSARSQRVREAGKLVSGMLPLSPPLVFKGKWSLGKKLGEGANAEVFEVENDPTYAMKICPLPIGKSKGAKAREATLRANSIYWESQLYNGIRQLFIN